jgi:hypothetical protein
MNIIQNIPMVTRLVFVTLAAIFIFPTAVHATDKTLTIYNTPGNAQDVAVVENYAYVADTVGIEVLNISNPSAPTHVGSIALDGIKTIKADASTLYAVDEHGISIVSVDDPANPVELGRYTVGRFDHPWPTPYPSPDHSVAR